MKLKKNLNGINNAGSTIIVVLIMCAFIMILATTLTTTVMLNLRMKIAKENEKSTFYTSEEAIDEIYVTLGKIAMESFNAAYIDELTHISLNNQLASNDNSITNIYANERFRKNFMARLLGDLNVLTTSQSQSLIDNVYSGDTEFENYKRALSVAEKENLISCMSTFLETDNSGKLKLKDILNAKINTSTALVTDTTAVNTNIENYSLVMENITVSYLNSMGYYSDITFDISIGFPDKILTFISDSLVGRIDFTNYVLIGNTGIVVAGNNDSKFFSNEMISPASTLNIYGNVYGGGNVGITINKDARLNFYGSDSENIVSGSDININGGSLYLTGGRLWTDNIFTKIYASSINIGSNAKVYAKDDLQLESDNSIVNINGDYYGYGYVAANGASHINSSSLIINSQNSFININSTSNVLLSGNAFITYDNKATPYSTGFSYASFGDQESYLVPSSYISAGINPVPLLSQTIFNNAGNLGVVEYKNVNVVITLDESFFAYSLLDSNTPYVLKIIQDEDNTGNAYYYLNFKNIAMKAIYAKIIEDDGAYENFKNNNSYYLNATSNEKEAFDAIRESANETLKVNSTSTGSDININSGAQITAISDTTYEEYESAINAGITDIEPDYSAYLTKYNNYAIRYNILQKILYQIDNVDTNLLSSEDVGNGDVVDVSGYSNNVFKNFVSESGFNKYIENRGNSSHNYGVINIDDYSLIAIDNSGVNGRAVIIDNTLTNSNLSNGEYKIDKGVVVATGDVVVRSDFTGVIFAKGCITIEGDVVVSSMSESEVINMIEADTGIDNTSGSNLYQYKTIFIYGEEKSSDDSSDDYEISYKEMVKMYNWSN